jgi:SAM-dependent methyltransferase
MGHRPLNIERNVCVLSLLSIKPTDRVLEIGLAGVGVGNAAANAAEVVGLDRSALKVCQATCRNKQLIEKGKLRLTLGSLEGLTPELGLLDRSISLNALQFWRPSVAVRLKTLLKPGGVILAAYMP